MQPLGLGRGRGGRSSQPSCKIHLWWGQSAGKRSPGLREGSDTSRCARTPELGSAGVCAVPPCPRSSREAPAAEVPDRDGIKRKTEKHKKNPLAPKLTYFCKANLHSCSGLLEPKNKKPLDPNLTPRLQFA